MLKERKELLEHELRRLHSEAANMYLSLVVSQNGDTSSPVYQRLKERISDVTFELKLVSELINKGQE